MLDFCPVHLMPARVQMNSVIKTHMANCASMPSMHLHVKAESREPAHKPKAARLVFGALNVLTLALWHRWGYGFPCYAPCILRGS